MRVLLFSIICCLSLPLRLLAADFIIASPDQFVKDSLFKVDILLDTADTEINALSGTVSYQGNQLILEDVSAGGSVVSLWLDPPILEKSLNNRL
ncbi:MAG: hypothetical protein NTX66_00820, partial [Candidatus Falkowbacteria bacterium]|nr:hypothetical protein [Candidatus Falkowbacteria bacterium]